MAEAETPLSVRARAIVEGLFRTKRAGLRRSFDEGMVRISCKKGGFYWISLDGARLLYGRTFLRAEELQPKFVDSMERAGR
jgi:hypothetical protein